MTKDKALRLKNAVFALVGISTAKAESRPAAKVESKPTAEPTAEPAAKSRLLYDSAGQVLPVRLATEIEKRTVNRIERLRLQSHKIINWFSSTEEQ